MQTSFLLSPSRRPASVRQMARRILTTARPLGRAAALAAFLSLGVAAQAGSLYLARLSAAGENPPTTSPATGTGVLILLDSQTQSLVSATHNVAAVTAGHIHRGAATVNGPVIFPFPNAASPVGPLTWNMSQGAVESLRAGELYMNFHTQEFQGGAIRGQLLRALLAPAATTPGQRSLADALDISAGYHDDLDAILVQTNLASTAVQTQTLTELSARTVAAAGRQQIEAMTGVANAAFSYLEDTRSLRTTASGATQAFVRFGSDFGRRDDTANQAGARISRPFALAGVDHRFTQDSRAGFILGYTHGSDSFDNNLGKTTTKTVSLHGFASYALGDTGIALDAQAGYGWGKIDTTRTLSALGRTATAAPKATVWNLAAKLSKSIALANHNTLAPYASFDVQKATVDGYTENGAAAASLVISERETWNAALEAGATMFIPLRRDSGSLALRFQAGWRHLIEDGSQRFGTWLVGSPIGFLTETEGVGRNSAHVEAALTGELAKGIDGALGYRGDLGANSQTVHTLEARIVIPF